MTLVVALSLAVALVVVPMALYLGVLALLARADGTPPFARPVRKFMVVVPAHNEALQISDTVRSVLAVDYPPHLREVVVVADNCTDATAAVARSAGARVLVRDDLEHQGKGFALAHAFADVLAQSDADAVAVVDADTVVSSNLLYAFAARLAAGAHAVQAEYGVRNPDVSWRTRLMTVALAMFHRTRSLARERLRLSVGLRGNGMCFSRQLLATRPYDAFSLVEDVEYGIAIALAGYRVAYAGEARVLGEMAASGRGAATQRRRWEHGRWTLARALLPKLAREAVRKRSSMLADLALDLAVPPVSFLGVAVGVGLTLEGIVWTGLGAPSAAFYLWLVALVSLVLYAARGVQHSGLGWRALAALGWAPLYVAWKLVILAPRFRPRVWVRTQREAEKQISG